MLIGSNLNFYKKLLEAEDQFFDFPSEDVSFNIQYSDYKKDKLFYDKEKYINSQYPEFEEEDGVGIVEFMSKAVGKFFILLGEKIDELYENDDSFYEASSNFTYNNLSREQQSDVNRKISSFLEEEFSNLRIQGISNIIDDYIYDSDVHSDIKLDIDTSINSLFLTDLYSYGYETFIELEDNDTIEVEGYDFSLSELKDYLEDEELMGLVLDYKNNIYLRNTYNQNNEKLDNNFIYQLEYYILHDKTIKEYILLGEADYSVVINKDELRDSFQSYIDDKEDIEYEYIQSEDNTVWEDEE